VTRRRIVAVVGNSRPPPEALPVAESLGRQIVEAGWRLVTGGKGGVMEAASRGAHTARGYREGDVLGILPTGDRASANSYVDIAVPTNLGYARNVLVVATADAVVAVGGGAGTLSEIAMAWQLGRPLVGLEVAGWSSKLAGQALDDKRGDVITPASTPEEAIAAVRRALVPG
jgi:uncharacterized protein (TIGR00725 family)